MNQATRLHRSTGLETLMNDLVSNGGAVLDLGPLSSGTTEVFLSKGCKCFVEDIAEIFPDLSEDQSNFRELIEDHLLHTKTQQKIKAVLCWDLLNYLSLSSIEILFKILSLQFDDDTVVHLMQYTGAYIPAQPKHFRLKDNSTYEFTTGGSVGEIPSPRHTLIQLLKRMGRFSLAHSHINQQGMHQSLKEMILTFGSPVDTREVKRTSRTESVAYFSSSKIPADLPILQPLIDDKTGLAEKTILDLGKKTGRNTHYLNQSAKQLYIEDLYSSMAWKKKITEDGESPLNVHALLLQEPAAFELVLCWDILNYCSPEQIRQFGRLLCKKMKPGSLLHTISYAENQVPERPATFNIEEDGELTVAGEITGAGSKPFSSTATLMKLLPDFVVTGYRFGSGADGNGFQEYLLERT